MEVMFWVWLAIIVVSAVIEFITCDLTSIWFTAGAVIPFILSAIGGIHWAIQLSLFVVLTCAFILVLRPLAKKYLLRNANLKTNADALIGKQCKMLEGCDFDGMGSVKVGDVVWSATSEDKSEIAKDEIVTVVKIDGNKLIVKKKED